MLRAAQRPRILPERKKEDSRFLRSEDSDSLGAPPPRCRISSSSPWDRPRDVFSVARRGGRLSPLGETEAPVAASLHSFPVGVPGVGGFGPATGLGAQPGASAVGERGAGRGSESASILPPAAVFIDSL